jgi:AraC family transcriptional regulator
MPQSPTKPPEAAPDWSQTEHPDRIVFRTDLVTVGAFRCAVGHPMFRDSGPIHQPCFVFPRTAVIIEHLAGTAFLADPTVVTLYNAKQVYDRRAVSPDGDRCDWYGVAPSLLRDAVRPFDPDAASDADRVIRHAFARSSAALYLQQRRLFAALHAESPPEGLAVEEAVCALLRHVLESAYCQNPAAPSPARASLRRGLTEAAKRILGRYFRAPMSLSSIAEALGCSPFHLSRSFHEETGLTLHRYRATLRLRASLELIEAKMPLTAVGLDVGYSSHSHFTQAFRAAFGVPPSRAALGRLRQVPRLRLLRVPELTLGRQLGRIVGEEDAERRERRRELNDGKY